MKKTVSSRNYKNVIAKDFDVLVDPDPERGGPVVALKVEPRRDEAFLLPMDMRTARNIAVMMLETVYKVSPELLIEVFNG